MLCEEIIDRSLLGAEITHDQLSYSRVGGNRRRNGTDKAIQRKTIVLARINLRGDVVALMRWIKLRRHGVRIQGMERLNRAARVKIGEPFQPVRVKALAVNIFTIERIEA